MLPSYPDCSDPHVGEYRNDTFYVVGIGTPNESVFPSHRSN